MCHENEGEGEGEEKICTVFLFFKNKIFKEILIRSKERKENNEKYVLISLSYQESNIFKH